MLDEEELWDDMSGGVDGSVEGEEAGMGTEGAGMCVRRPRSVSFAK